MGTLGAVDVFCGAGGLTRGLLDAGVKVKAGIDNDPLCKYPFEQNNGVRFHLKDVREVTANQVRKMLGARPYLIAGCAPCQPFALLGDFKLDDRKHLLGHFGRLVYGVVPEYVTMENVPGLRRRRVFSDFLKKLRKRGYYVDFRVVDASEFGVPQRRRRLVVLASRLGPIEVPCGAGDSLVTVRQSIEQLPALEAGSADVGDPIHRAVRLSELNLRRIQASRAGGSWADWPDELWLECHRRSSGKGYIHPYGRMAWDAPSPTITTKFFNLGSGRFGHPSQDRAITPREGAILQTFPRDYEFVPPQKEPSVTELGRLIGNAVPVSLAKHIGVAILDHWKQYGGNE